MEGLVKGDDKEGAVEVKWAATVVTLIFAGRLGRSRMTVIRRRAASDLKRGLGTAKKNRGFSAEVADLDRTFRDRRRDQAAGASTTCPMDQTKPASSRATAVTDF